MPDIRQDVMDFLLALKFNISQEGEERDFLAARPAYGTIRRIFISFLFSSFSEEEKTWQNYGPKFAAINRRYDGQVETCLITDKDFEKEESFLTIKDLCKSEGINISTYHGFISRFLDVSLLNQGVDSIPDLKFDFKKYVSQDIEFPISGKFRPKYIIDDWLSSSEKDRFLVIHGDPGVGKTELVKYITFYLFSKGEEKAYMPIPFPVQFVFNLNATGVRDLVESALKRYNHAELTYEAFKILLKQGCVLLMVDGFDELTERAGREKIVEELKGLSQTVHKRYLGRVILTYRSAFEICYESIAEYLGNFGQDKSVGLLKGRLLPFGDNQIKKWLESNTPSENKVRKKQHIKKVLSIIYKKPHIREAVSNPYELSLLSQEIWEIPNFSPRDSIKIYEKRAKTIFKRERKRQNHDLSDDEQFTFLQKLAEDSYKYDKGFSSYDKSLLSIIVEEVFERRLRSARAEDRESEEKERVVNSFLKHHFVRPSSIISGEVGIHQQKFRAFFAACELANVILEGSESDCKSSAILKKDLPQEVIEFTVQILREREEEAIPRIKNLYDVSIQEQQEVNCFRNVLRISQMMKNIRQVFPSIYSFQNKRLNEFHFNGENLTDYSFNHAKLVRVEFWNRCSLEGCDVRGATIKFTYFDNKCNLRDADFTDTSNFISAFLGTKEELTEDEPAFRSWLSDKGAKVKGIKLRDYRKDICELMTRIFKSFISDPFAYKVIEVHKDEFLKSLKKVKGYEWSFVINETIPYLEKIYWESFKSKGKRYLRLRSGGIRKEVCDFCGHKTETDNIRGIIDDLTGKYKEYLMPLKNN